MKANEPSVIYNKIGNVLKKERKAQGLSQEKLAALSNVDRSHIGFIEQGRRRPTLSTIVKLSHALELSLEKLFRDL